MILYALYVNAIFFPCHPYIWSTTVLHDMHVTFDLSIAAELGCMASLTEKYKQTPLSRSCSIVPDTLSPVHQSSLQV